MTAEKNATPSSSTSRGPLSDLRGACRLAIEATLCVAGVVEAMQLGIGAGPSIIGRPLERPVRLFTGPIHGSLRAVTGAVGDWIDAALGRLAPLVALLVGTDVAGSRRDAVVAVLNGVLGDHLAERANPLAIEMQLRLDGRPLALDAASLARAFPRATRRLLVLAGVTGLRHGCVLDAHWAGRDRFSRHADDRSPVPLPEAVRCYAIAATASVAGAAGKLRSDGLVSVESALGLHARPELTLRFPEAHRWIAYGTKHLDLLDDPGGYATLRAWLSEGRWAPRLPR